MKTEPAPKTKVPPNWEDRPDSFDRFDNAVRHIFTVSKEDVLKAEAKHKRPRTKKPTRRKAVA
jgi:hypothetical protein